MSMTSSVTNDRVRTSAFDAIWRRVGQFSVGTFAGLCAALGPRLSLQVSASSTETATLLDAFSVDYLVVALVFSLLVGGVAMVLEWDGHRPPRETFVAALGVPALLTGMFNTAQVNQEAIRQADKVKRISDEQAEQHGIPVSDGLQGTLMPSNDSRWAPPFTVTLQASELDGPHPAPAQSEKRAGTDRGLELGVRYREPHYWIVLHVAADEAAAKTWASRLGGRYGELRVQKLGDDYVVCPAGEPLPYSEAVSRAADLKHRSKGELAPKLVRAG